MIKEKRILSYFLGWLFVGFLVCFFGITDVFADEKERLGFLSDKTNIQIVVPYNGSPLSLDQYGEYYLTEADQLLVFVDNYNFIGGNIYQLELYLPNATLTNADTFTVYGTTTDTNENISCNAMKILQDNKQYVNYRWRCNKDVDSLTFTIKNSNNENIVSSGTFRWDYSFLWNVLSTTDNSEIIGGLNDVQQSIIDSNKETQDIIKDQFNDCIDSYNLLNMPYTENNKLTNTSAKSDDFWETDYYVYLKEGITYTFSVDTDASWGTVEAFLLKDKAYDVFYNMESKVYTFTPTSTGNYYIRYDINNPNITASFWNFQIVEGSSNKPFKPYGEICTNKLDNIEQSIVDSNKETQDIIKDQFNSCRDSYNLLDMSSITSKVINGVTFTKNTDGTITINGTATANTYFNLPKLTLTTGKYFLSGIDKNDNTNIKLSMIANYQKYYFDNGNGVEINILGSITPSEFYILIPNGSTANNVIVKPMITTYENRNQSYEPYGKEICSNKIDETNDKLDNLQGALTDSSPTDMSGLGNSAGWLPAGPVDSILTLPLTMLNNLVNNLSSNNCQTAILQLPYVKKNINLPCIKTLYDKIGITGTLFQSAGLIASAFILFNYLLKLYQWVDNTLTMRENTMPGYFDDNWGGGA